ncbi:hypothetical protein AAY473_011912 [Plecturocebus cupreus]
MGQEENACSGIFRAPHYQGPSSKGFKKELSKMYLKHGKHFHKLRGVEEKYSKCPEEQKCWDCRHEPPCPAEDKLSDVVLTFQHFGNLKRADHLRTGVQDQPGQHGETPSLLKVQKLDGHGSFLSYDSNLQNTAIANGEKPNENEKYQYTAESEWSVVDLRSQTNDSKTTMVQKQQAKPTAMVDNSDETTFPFWANP